MDVVRAESCNGMTTMEVSHHHGTIPSPVYHLHRSISPPDFPTTGVSHHHHHFVGCSCSSKLSSDHKNWVVPTQAGDRQAPQRPIWTHFLPVWALLAQNRLCDACAAALRQTGLKGREGVCTCRNTGKIFILKPFNRFFFLRKVTFKKKENQTHKVSLKTTSERRS